MSTQQAIARVQHFDEGANRLNNNNGSNNEINFDLERVKVANSDFATIIEELRQLRENSDQNWYLIGIRLSKIANERNFRSGGFRSFSDFCVKGFGCSRQHAYKLMKVSEFLNSYWMSAQSPKQRFTVKRLYNLGFTKLYVLHSLAMEKIESLLDDGITLPINDYYPERTITLEASTVWQLRNYLSNNGDGHMSDRASSRQHSGRSLNALIQTQAKSLLSYIEKCKDDYSLGTNGEDCLKTIEQFAEAIAHGINALNWGVQPEVQPTLTALVVEKDDNAFAALYDQLTGANIRVLRTLELDSVKEKFIGTFDLLIMNGKSMDEMLPGKSEQ